MRKITQKLSSSASILVISYDPSVGLLKSYLLKRYFTGWGCARTRLPQLHGYASGRPSCCTVPGAWVDAEYKALHGLRLVLDCLKESGCVEVTPCVRVEIAFID